MEERAASRFLIVLGVVLLGATLAAAAAGVLASAVATVSMGAGLFLVVLGVVFPRLDMFKGPGFEFHLRKRSQDLIQAAEASPDPKVADAMRESLRYLEESLEDARSKVDTLDLHNKKALQHVTATLGRLRSDPVNLSFRADKNPPTMCLENTLDRDRHLQRIALDREGHRGQMELTPTNLTLPHTLGPGEVVNIQFDNAEVPNDTARVALTIDEELSVYIVNDEERMRLRNRGT